MSGEHNDLISTLQNLETARFTETSVNCYRATQRHGTKGGLLHTYRRLISYEYAYVYVCMYIYIQGVPGVKVTTSGFNSRTDCESKTSYTHGSNSQRFRSYEISKYSK